MKLLGIAIVLLFLSSMPVAAALEDRTEYINARYTKIACGIDFRTDVLEVTAEKVPQASNLKPHVKTLSEDKAELHALATEVNAKEFRVYVRETLRPHMKEAKEALKKDWEKFEQWQVSEEIITELREEYKKSRSEFKDCRDAAIIHVGNAKVAWYETHLEKKQAKTDDLSARGVDVTEMNEVISGAWTQIVNPLQNAVSTEDPGTVKNALRTYRLFNGGNESSISYHFAANYRVARLGAILAAIAPIANDAGYGDRVTSIQDIADSTDALLSEIGYKKYAPGEGEEVWSSIRNGFTMLRELSQLLRNMVQTSNVA